MLPLPAGNYTSGGKTYFFFTKKLNFTDAMDACMYNVSTNARLVNFLSASEQSEVEQYFITNGFMNSSASYWYGSWTDPSGEQHRQARLRPHGACWPRLHGPKPVLHTILQ